VPKSPPNRIGCGNDPQTVKSADDLRIWKWDFGNEKPHPERGLNWTGLHWRHAFENLKNAPQLSLDFSIREYCSIRNPLTGLLYGPVQNERRSAGFSALPKLTRSADVPARSSAIDFLPSNPNSAANPCQGELFYVLVSAAIFPKDALGSVDSRRRP
jgi:hypothetical protein